MSGIEIFGVISGVVGILGFLQDQIPEPTEGPSTTVRVQVGLDGTSGPSGDLTNAGGDVPAIRTYNAVGEETGFNSGEGTIENGAFFDIVVEHSANVQSPYLLLTESGDDAICIAYVTATWPDSQQWGWVGDWAQQCGNTWYESGVRLQDVDAGTTRTVQCGWVDSNGDSGPEIGLSVFWDDFRRLDNGSPNPDPTGLCDNGYSYSVYTERGFAGPPNFAPEVAIAGPEARSIPAPTRMHARHGGNKFANETRLVVSSAQSSSAKRLCESATSFGPDFYSTSEGLFCDMEDKTLYPVCSRMTGSTNCFDATSHTILSASGLAKRDVSYTNTLNWE